MTELVDITERKRAERERVQLLASEQAARAEAGIEKRYRKLLEAAPDAILEVDRQGQIVLVNVQAEKLFGYTRAELLGKPVESLIPERFQDPHPGHRDGLLRPSGDEAHGDGPGAVCEARRWHRIRRGCDPQPIRGRGRATA